MKHPKTFARRAVCGLLALSLAAAPSLSGAVLASDNSAITKQETVYMFLAADGSLKSTTVSSWLHADSGVRGLGEPTSLTDIKNVKSETAPTLKDGVLSWDMDGNDAYYQGASDATPPIAVSITYKLDGKDIAPADLAGKSGKVEITVAFKNNCRSSATVGGVSREIYTPFATTAVLDLPTDTFQNVKCSGGSVLSEGTNQVVTILAVPGLKDSLGKDADTLKQISDFSLQDTFTVTAEAKNFKLGSVVIAATPSLPLDKLKGDISLGELSSGLSQLQSATEQLASGTQQLSEALATYSGKMEELDSGISDLSAGAGDLLAGVTQYTDGVQQLFDEIDQLLPGLEAQMGQSGQAIAQDLQNLAGKGQTASQEMQDITQQMGALYQQILAIKQADPSADITALLGAFGALKQQLEEHGATLTALGQDMQTLATDAGSMQTDLATGLQTAKEQLAQAEAQLRQGSTDLLQGAKDLSDGAAGDKDATGQLSGAARTISEKSGELDQGMNTYKTTGIDPAKGQIDELVGDADNLLALKDALIAQSESYQSFAGSPEGCDTTTAFVMKTDEISAPKTEKKGGESKKAEKKTGLWDRIKGLFS